MIAAGKLRHRVTIQKPPTGRTVRGTRTNSVWSDVATGAAYIRSRTGDEKESANQMIATATHQVTVRVRRTFELTTKMRFKFRNRYLDIGSVDNIDEENGIWVCLCSEAKK